MKCSSCWGQSDKISSEFVWHWSGSHTLPIFFLLSTKLTINTSQLLVKNVSHTHCENGYPERVEIHFSTFYLRLMTCWHWVLSRPWRITVRSLLDNHSKFLHTWGGCIHYFRREKYGFISYYIQLHCSIQCSFLFVTVALWELGPFHLIRLLVSI